VNAWVGTCLHTHAHAYVGMFTQRYMRMGAYVCDHLRWVNWTNYFYVYVMYTWYDKTPLDPRAAAPCTPIVLDYRCMGWFKNTSLLRVHLMFLITDVWYDYRTHAAPCTHIVLDHRCMGWVKNTRPPRIATPQLRPSTHITAHVNL
jgi:hypothetical protein